MKVIYKDIQPWVESLKELARVAIIAAIPVTIDGLTAGAINWRLVVASAVIASLRALDKLLHLEGKVEGNALLTGGLTRF